MRLSSLALAIASVSLFPTLAPAQDYSFNVAARQGEMDLMAINAGVLGDMAKGKTPYDAATAVTAAKNIVAVSSITQEMLWPKGSSNAEMKDTKALPKIWEDYEDFVADWNAKGQAAEALLAAAGNGQEALTAAVAKLGEACTACHKEYRQPNN